MAFSQEIADRICERIATGEPLETICRDDGLPSSATVRRWILDDVEGFAALSVRAYMLGYEALAEQCLEISNTPVQGVERTVKADGSIEEKQGDMLQHRRLQIDTRMRLLGKWAPKRYGDKLDVTLEVNDRASILRKKREERMSVSSGDTSS